MAPAAARAAVVTSPLISQQDKRRRLDGLAGVEADPDGAELPPWDAVRESFIPWLGLGGFVGAIVLGLVPGAPFLPAMNLALVALLAGSLVDFLLMRALSRSRVKRLLRQGDHAAAVRLARRREVGTLKDLGLALQHDY